MIKLALTAQQQFKLERERLRGEQSIAKMRESARKKQVEAEIKSTERKRKSREAFAKQVEAQNVRGVLPTVEERGMHAKPSFNPFNPPMRERIRDRNGLFITR